MAMRRFSFEDEEGVSEVVGSILTLVITVVLFSSVFAAVTQIEPPEEQPHVNLSTEYEYANGIDYINITHDGGKTLPIDDLNFMVLIGEDYDEHRDYVIGDGELTLTGNDDSVWSIGQRVQIKDEILDEIEEEEPFVEFWIENTDDNRIIYQTVLLEEGLDLIDIRNARIDYHYEWRNYALRGEEITIKAEIVSPIYKSRERFDFEDNVSMYFSIHEDGVLEEGDTGEEIRMDHTHNGEFERTVNITNTAEYASYSLKMNAELDERLSTQTYIRMNLGPEAAKRFQPDLVVGEIRYTPGSPTHHDEFTVEIDVYNRGAVNYTAGWNLTDNDVKEHEEETKFERGPAPTVVTANYQITGVGRHEIEVNINTTFEDPRGNEVEDSDPENNMRKINVYVDPNVLVVRDVTARDQDELGLMTNELSGLNLDYGVYEVDSVGDYPTEEDLREYSVVVWMTGDSEEGDPEPLPEEAQDKLVELIEDYYCKLWLMGSNLEYIDFTDDLLGKLGIEGGIGGGEEITIEGELANPEEDEDGTYGEYKYPVYPESDAYDFSGNLEDHLERNRLEDEDGQIVGIGYNSSGDQRTAVNSFLYESIEDPAARANMAQEVIKWLSGLDIRSGTDVAVSSQRIEPTTDPMFMDEIEIKATLRNNGPEDLNVTVRAVRNQGEEVLEPNIEGPFVHIPRNGGTAEVTFDWTADVLGEHEFLVEADYFGEIDEVNLENNNILYKDLDITEDEIEVDVRYSALVVDADLHESEDNTNTTGEVVESFDRLGLEQGIDYDYYLVESSTDDGPTTDEMRDYNVVYWVTGERGTTVSIVLSENDVDNLVGYLEQGDGANAMFIGEHMLSDLQSMYEDENTQAEELMRYMAVEPGTVESNALAPATLIGKEDNQLGHALKYDVGEGAVGIDKFELADHDHGEALFEDYWGNKTSTTYDDGSVKTAYVGVNLDRITGPIVDGELLEEWPGGEVNVSAESAREEFIYTSLWHFGYRDERPELRVTDYDIEFSTDNPETGRSYEVTVEIENIGYTSSNAMVRLKEGEDHIDTESVRIGPSQRSSEAGSSYFDVEANSTTAEFTWEPVFSGHRPIRVKIDPLGRIDEIEGEDGKIMEFNNHASVAHPVYYFHDDMESGDEKWEHDATLMNIDGDSPLDFISMDGVRNNTEVEGDWDWDKSGSTSVEDNASLEGEGVYETDESDIEEFVDDDPYSPPRSFWLPESEGDPEGERAPLDLVLIIDRGQTISEEEFGYVIEGAEAAINLTVPGDKVSIYSVGEGGNIDARIRLNEPESEIETEQDKEDIKGELPGHQTSQRNALLAAMSRAVYDLDEYGREDATKGIISLTDGTSNQDGYSGEGDDYISHDDNEDEQKGPVQWYDAEEDDDKGLLGIPYNVMTVTISDAIEPRKHWVSATSTADVTYGVLENDTTKLEDIYEMFVWDLIRTEMGDLRSAPGIEPHPMDTPSESTTSLIDMDPIEDAQFFVFSDAFTTGWLDEDVTYDWEDGEKIPAYGRYEVFEGFEHVTEKGIKDTQGQDWVVVTSESEGSKIGNTVYPRDTLDELDGSYSVNQAHAHFYMETDEDHDDFSLRLKIVQNGKTIFERTGIQDDDEGEYINVAIPDISDAEPFYFELEHEGSDEKIILDDLSFTYEVDYHPEDEYDFEIGRNKKYRYFTTPSIDLGEQENIKDASLEFQHKYRMTDGATGGFIYLWGKEEGANEWTWEQDNRLYVKPEGSYTGNLNFERIEGEIGEGGLNLTGEGDGLKDAEGNIPQWVFTRKSASGSFDWTFDRVNIGQYEEFLQEYDEVRAVFTLAQLGGLAEEDGWESEMGWYLDNVRFKVSSEWERDGPGYWNLTSASQLEDMGITEYQGEEGIENYYDRTQGDEDGNYWMFTAEEGGEDVLPKGVDSSLYTRPIYLDNARNPILTAHMKFNINESAGLPPDGFRVEISDDDGRTWDSITYGARSGWGYSGYGDRYSGGWDDGEPEEYDWVTSESLVRLETDLSGWRGERIMLRFRVFTNTTEKYANEDLPRAVFIDDVSVVEEDMIYEEDRYKLVIRSTRGGSVEHPGEGRFIIDSGEDIDLEAVVDDHLEDYIDEADFEWTGDTEKIDNPDLFNASLEMPSENVSIKADFGDSDLTIDSTEGGSVTQPGEDTFTYETGTRVVLSASPDEHYRFEEWTGDIEDIDDPNSPDTTIMLKDDYSIIANFELKGYDLDVDSTSGGEVEEPGEGTFTYDAMDEVYLKAEADDGWYFDRWTGDISEIDDRTSHETTIEMLDDYDITAEFEAYVDLTIGSTAGGEVVVPGEGTFEDYENGETVDLEAVADEGYYFAGWTGDVGDIADTTANETTIDMFDNYTITAEFEPNLDLNVGSTSGGEVTEPGEGTFDYARGETVDLEAVADEDRSFLGWSGDTETIDDPEASETEIEILDDYTIMAVFDVDTHELTVDSHENGEVVTPGEGTYVYDAGAEVDIEAVAEEGYHFDEWTGDDGTIADTTDNETTITMDGDYTITAEFAINEYELDVSSTEGGDVVGPGEDTFEYEHGTEVELEAVEEEDRSFVRWSGDNETIADTTENKTTIEMLDDHTIMAVFDVETRMLTVESTEGGEVVTPGEGTYVYDADAEVDIDAVADEGHHFVEWTGDNETIDDTTARETTITMEDNYTITAEFDINEYELSVSSTEDGEVVEPGEDTFEYEHGTEVELEAVADEDHHFFEWTGDKETIEDTADNRTTIEMLDDYDITAEFEPYVTLTIDSTGDGEVVEPGEDTYEYEYGTEVELEAVADEGHHFFEWTGDNETIEDPAENETIIEMDDDYTITAEFAINEYDLDVSSTEAGQVIEPGEGTFEYEYGTVVDLEAEPLTDEAQSFVRWSGDNGTIDNTTDNRTTIEMLDDYDITAEFELMEYDLTIDSTEGGEVVRPGEGDHEYEHGTEVELEAIADEGYTFVEWIGANETIEDTEENETTMEMLANYDIEAEFEEESLYMEDLMMDVEGTTEYEPEDMIFEESTEVKLERTSDENSMVEGWIREAVDIVDGVEVTQ